MICPPDGGAVPLCVGCVRSPAVWPQHSVKTCWTLMNACCCSQTAEESDSETEKKNGDYSLSKGLLLKYFLCKDSPGQHKIVQYRYLSFSVAQDILQLVRMGSTVET